MIIQMSKFGNVLTSRPAGGEAYKALRPRLSELKSGDNIKLDFSGVDVLTPSWADEFLAPLLKDYPKQVVWLNTDNASVQENLKILGYDR